MKVKDLKDLLDGFDDETKIEMFFTDGYVVIKDIKITQILPPTNKNKMLKLKLTKD